MSCTRQEKKIPPAPVREDGGKKKSLKDRLLRKEMAYSGRPRILQAFLYMTFSSTSGLKGRLL